VPDILVVVTPHEKAEHLAIVVEKLFLRRHLTAAQFLLEILQQVFVFLGSHGLQGFGKAVFRASLRASLRLTEFVEEGSRVFVGIVDANRAAANSNIKSYAEIRGLKRCLTSILSEKHLSL